MKHRLRLAAALALSLAALPALAAAQDPIAVHAPWARATVPGQPNGAGYMEIANPGGQADRLVGVSSPAAERVEIHTVQTEGGIARMREVDGVDVPAGGTASLAPGGLHVMFLKLKSPLSAGTQVPARLHFEHAGEVPVQFEVKPAAYQGGGGDAGHRHGMKH